MPGCLPGSIVPSNESNPRNRAPFIVAHDKSRFSSNRGKYFEITFNSSRTDKVLLDAKLSVPIVTGKPEEARSGISGNLFSIKRFAFGQRHKNNSGFIPVFLFLFRFIPACRTGRCFNVRFMYRISSPDVKVL